MKSTLKEFMSVDFFRRMEMDHSPTLHYLCISRTGVARPGKTARDRANGQVAYTVNRRVWEFFPSPMIDNVGNLITGQWVKV